MSEARSSPEHVGHDREDADEAGERIEVEVRTPDGERAKFQVSLSETVGALKVKAVAKLGITPAPGTQFFLFLGGKRLSDDLTLREAGINDDAVLTLASEPQVGGRV
jgi:hypothetical protein